MGKIFLVRHGEQPILDGQESDGSNLENEASELGLTLQGSVRTWCMPKLVNRLIGHKEKYQIHTYANYKNNSPVSRAYYTTQILRQKKRCQGIILYDKSQNIYELVENILNQSQYVDNIIVCWEHETIPKIIQRLIGLSQPPNYRTIVDTFEPVLISQDKIQLSDIKKIQRCSPDFQFQNKLHKYDITKGIHELAYAPVWKVNLTKKSYKVFPGFTIQPDKNKLWLVNWYI